MKRTNKIILTTVLVAVLILGIGYAAIQNITLNITGSAEGTASDANFGVKFAKETTTDKSEVTNESAATVKAEVTGYLAATLTVEGVSAKGDTVTATYTVQNTSADLSADLSVSATNDNEEYFSVEPKLGKKSIKAGEATTLVVTVELLKTPITNDETATIGIQLKAVPVQPGEEGTSGGNNGGGSGSTGMPDGIYLPTGFSKVAGTSLETGLTSIQYTALKQKMLKSVYQNGGFYVGKYETGIEEAPKTSGNASTAQQKHQ